MFHGAEILRRMIFHDVKFCMVCCPLMQKFRAVSGSILQKLCVVLSSMVQKLCPVMTYSIKHTFCCLNKANDAEKVCCNMVPSITCNKKILQKSVLVAYFHLDSPPPLSPFQNDWLQ